LLKVSKTITKQIDRALRSLLSNDFLAVDNIIRRGYRKTTQFELL